MDIYIQRKIKIKVISTFFKINLYIYIYIYIYVYIYNIKGYPNTKHTQTPMSLNVFFVYDATITTNTNDIVVTRSSGLSAVDTIVGSELGSFIILDPQKGILPNIESLGTAAEDIILIQSTVPFDGVNPF